MTKDSVVLGFSGVIDSAAAIILLQSQGFKVEALTLDMCGDANMVAQAQKRAGELGVNFSTINCHELFKKEIKDYFISEYLAGRTPAPCTRCNPYIKWKLLIDYANQQGIYHVATGHYFRIKEYNNHLYVARPADAKKDQSYYLWGLTAPTLSRASTPMAEIIKEDVKRSSTQKSESMGVCFLRGMRYSDYILNECGELPMGDITNKAGEVIGRHNGIANYTIGQKRGEGIPSGSVIVGINASENRLIAGDNSDLFHHKLYISQTNFIDREEVLDADDISVMIRGIGRNPEGFARVKEISKSAGEYCIELSSPSWAAAEGQPIVLYRDDRVIGGGYLDSAL